MATTISSVFNFLEYPPAIPELNNKNYMIRSGAERIALNTPIQGTAADVIKIAMVKLFNEFNKHNLKSKMLIQVHDELVIDCKKNEFDIVKKGGAWYSYEGNKIGQGRENAKSYFEENAEVFFEIEQQYNVNGLFIAAIGIHERLILKRRIIRIYG